MAADRDRDPTRRRSRTDFTLEDSVLEINEKRDLVPRRSGWQSEPSPQAPQAGFTVGFTTRWGRDICTFKAADLAVDYTARIPRIG